MKNLPDKIYIQPNAHDRWFEGNKPNDNFVEYVRKDAFIEKTEKWLNEHILDYVYAKEWGQGVGVEGELFEDFKEYTKEE